MTSSIYGFILNVIKNKQTYNYLKLDSSHCFCTSCTKEFLPFSVIEDGKFAYATIVKIIKVTHVLNTPNSIRENFIQDRNSSQCFIFNDLTALNYGKSNDFSVFYIEHILFAISLWWAENVFINLSYWFSNRYFWVVTKNWHLSNHKYTTSRIQHWVNGNRICKWRYLTLY